MGDPGQPLAGRTPFLTDFGLAKAVATGSKYTRTGQALGTPAYMSPEQARGETAALTAATDVWSLGCVLYELLAGRPPFEGDNPAAVIGRVLAAEPRSPRSGRPDIPAGIEPVMRAALAKIAGHRYALARELRDDLDRVLHGERPRARMARARWPWVAAALGGAVAACVVVLAWPRAPATPDGITVLARSGAEKIARQARFLRTTDPAEAARLLAQALAAVPARHDWRLERGLLLWAVGNGEDARDAWGRVPAHAPEAAYARLYAGLEAFFRQEGGVLAVEESVLHFEAAARAGGRTARLAAGALAAGRRDWPAARLALQGEAGWEAALLRGYVEGTATAGDRGAASREYGQALAQGIPFAWAHNNRGVVRRVQGDLAGAIEDHVAALRLRPGFPEALNNRGAARQDQGDLVGAREDFTAALHLRPNYPDALINRGLARRAQGDLAGAIEEFTAALRLQPDHPNALNSRGVARQDQRDLAGAIEDFTAALRVWPDSPDARYNRGNARKDLGDLPGAMEDYGASLRLRPDYPDALNNRGALRQDQGDLGGAIEDFTAALRLRPDYPDALYNRGDARLAQGDVAGAIEDYGAALRLRPDDSNALNNRGVARQAQGDLAGAIEDFTAALRLRPNFPDTHANLGLARQALRDWSGAAESFRECLRLAPQHARADEFGILLAKCEEKARAVGGPGR